MKAKCIDNSDYQKVLTEGKIYEVKKSNLGLEYFFSIIGDTKDKIIAYQKRFEIVKEEPITRLTKKQNFVNPFFLNQFSRKQLRELAKQLGVKPGKTTWCKTWQRQMEHNV